MEVCGKRSLLDMPDAKWVLGFSFRSGSCRLDPAGLAGAPGRVGLNEEKCAELPEPKRSELSLGFRVLLGLSFLFRCDGRHPSNAGQLLGPRRLFTRA